MRLGQKDKLIKIFYKTNNKSEKKCAKYFKSKSKIKNNSFINGLLWKKFKLKINIYFQYFRSFSLMIVFFWSKKREKTVSKSKNKKTSNSSIHCLCRWGLGQDFI